MAGSNFWKDILKLVILAGFVIIGLTSLALVGVATYGDVRFAITEDTKFYFMADVTNKCLALWLWLHLCHILRLHVLQTCISSFPTFDSLTDSYYSRIILLLVTHAYIANQLILLIYIDFY